MWNVVLVCSTHYVVEPIKVCSCMGKGTSFGKRVVDRSGDCDMSVGRGGRVQQQVGLSTVGCVMAVGRRSAPRINSVESEPHSQLSCVGRVEGRQWRSNGSITAENKE